ncbi:MAG: VOC family protein [Gemmatimonadota bacterium]
MKQSITHVALVVRDHDEAIAFFTEKLLFSLVEDQYIPEQNKRWVAVATPGCTGTSFLLARPMHASYGTVAVFKDLYGNPWELVERSSE